MAREARTIADVAGAVDCTRFSGRWRRCPSRVTMGGCALGCMCVWVEDAACFYQVPSVSVDVSLEAVGRRLASAGSIGVFGQRAQRLHAMDGWGVHGCYVVRWRSGAAVMCGGDALPVEK